MEDRSPRQTPPAARPLKFRHIPMPSRRRAYRRRIGLSGVCALLLAAPVGLAIQTRAPVPIERRLGATVAKPQPEPKPERRPCCAVGIAYNSGPGQVVLEQICNRGGASHFLFRLEGLDSACTHPPGTVLRDQNGRRYAMRSFSGIPACNSGIFSQPAQRRFTWVFERLPRSVRKITLLEVEDEVTSGLVFWAWRDVDLSHCKF